MTLGSGGEGAVGSLGNLAAAAWFFSETVLWFQVCEFQLVMPEGIADNIRRCEKR